MVKECKHENMKRLYERGKSWESTTLYKCQDCNEILRKGFEKVKPKQLNKQKGIKEQTEGLFDEDAQEVKTE